MAIFELYRGTDAVGLKEKCILEGKMMSFVTYSGVVVQSVEMLGSI